MPVRLSAMMRGCLAYAQGVTQVLLVIIAGGTAKLLVMDFKIRNIVVTRPPHPQPTIYDRTN
jgi:hypothetical protein